MTQSTEPLKTSSPSRARRVWLLVVTTVLSVAVALLIAEVLLRLVPVPGIAYHTFYYDPVTGGKHYPNSKVIYRSDRGDTVKRSVNSWGFVDLERSVEKPANTFRIGFFGDSYTEARQVEQHETFVRLVQDKLNAARPASQPRVETLSFATAGRSTLMSYLECQQWMTRADLDVVVYVFVENDPGDQLRSVSPFDNIPFVELSGDTFTVDRSFAERYRHKEGSLHRAQQYLKSRSLVISTIAARLRLLLRYGIRTRVTDADRDGAAPDGSPGMAVSTWPDELANDGWEAVERVMTRWRAEVESDGRRFIATRVPRESQIEKPLAEQDAWAPRFHEFCHRTGTQHIDPTPYLLEAMSGGAEVYYDHFTPAGHEAFSDAFVESFTGAGLAPDHD